jgi:hypothetical protein
MNCHFFCTFIAILAFGGSSSYRYVWNKTSEKMDSETKTSMQTASDYKRLSDSSTRSSSASNQPVSSVDISIQPRVLYLNAIGKIIFSWIKLPEEYDPHDIAVKSIGLTVVSCPKCEVIYPSYQFPIHRQYLTVFPRQDLIEKIKTMDLNLPTKLNLKIYGELSDGTPFEGSETIRIIKQKNEP